MPTVMISISKDGGRTWGNWKFRDLGDVGEYGKSIKAGPFGTGRQFVARIRVADHVRADLLGASAAVEAKE